MGNLIDRTVEEGNASKLSLGRLRDAIYQLSRESPSTLGFVLAEHIESIRERLNLLKHFVDRHGKSQKSLPSPSPHIEVPERDDQRSNDCLRFLRELSCTLPSVDATMEINELKTALGASNGEITALMERVKSHQMERDTMISEVSRLRDQVARAQACESQLEGLLHTHNSLLENHIRLEADLAVEKSVNENYDSILKKVGVGLQEMASKLECDEATIKHSSDDLPQIISLLRAKIAQIFERNNKKFSEYQELKQCIVTTSSNCKDVKTGLDHLVASFHGQKCLNMNWIRTVLNYSKHKLLRNSSGDYREENVRMRLEMNKMAEEHSRELRKLNLKLQEFSDVQI